MIEYIKFWLAREVADAIVFLPLLLIAIIIYIIYLKWFDTDDNK